MRLIDNKKDYYDYLAGVYGIDTYITYDRRNSTRLYNKSNQSEVSVNYPWHPALFCPYKNGVLPGLEGTLAMYSYKWDEQKTSSTYPGYYAVHKYTVGILVGFKLYIVDVTRLLKNPEDTTVKIVPHLVCVKDYDRREKSGSIKNILSPILIGAISLNSWYPWTWKIRSEKNYADDLYRNVSFSSDDNILENPIMEGTWIPSIIPAEDVWNNVTDYLLAIKEKPIIDNRTDVEHLESAGFDKKTSFRNM